MKTNLTIILFILVISKYLISLEFIAEDFFEDKQDFHGYIYPIKDNNNENCTLIRIESDASTELKMINVKVYKTEQISSNINYFYISNAEKNFSIKADGYLMFDYEIPIEILNSAEVYILKLKSVDNEDKTRSSYITVNFILNKQPDHVYIDNEKSLLTSHEMLNKFLFEMDFKKGYHEIKLLKNKYKEININRVFELPGETINKVFEKKIGTVSIKTIPENLSVQFDNKDIGRTPTEVIAKEPGVYNIQFKYKDFTIHTDANIAYGENVLLYDLKKDYITYVDISTKFENTYFVFDGLSSKKRLSAEIMPGSYPLEIYYYDYKIITKDISVAPGYNEIDIDLNNYFNANLFKKYVNRIDDTESESKSSLYATCLYLIFSGFLYYQTESYYNKYNDSNSVLDAIHYKKKFDQHKRYADITFGLDIFFLCDFLFSKSSNIYYKSKINQTLKAIELK